MSECDICKGCKCPEVKTLEEKIMRMNSTLAMAVNHLYFIVGELQEEKKCQ